MEVRDEAGKLIGSIDLSGDAIFDGTYDVFVVREQPGLARYVPSAEPQMVRTLRLKRGIWRDDAGTREAYMVGGQDEIDLLRADYRFRPAENKKRPRAEARNLGAAGGTIAGPSCGEKR